MERQAQILDRILGLRDWSPFVLLVDSLGQTALPLLGEFRHRAPSDCEVIEVENLEELEIKKTAARVLILVRDLGKANDINSFRKLWVPGVKTSLVGIFHEDLELPLGYQPHGRRLLEYMATTIVQVVPDEEYLEKTVNNPIERFDILPQPRFKVNVELKRRSGKSTKADFVVDSINHTTRFIPPRSTDTTAEDDSILNNIATFNLTTTDKQRASREDVDLPFMEAQEGEIGERIGGAIVYEFEKDDDYDEEDPYEDPF